jgi:acyl-CoA reductase-like NAD-dependent aldehyde dehydrogenase
MTTTEYRHCIGGDWTEASGGATFEDLDPYLGEVVARVAAGTRQDARRAVEAAQAAFPAWSQAPPAERQRVLLAAADILERRADEVVGLLARETGCCTYGFGMFQLGFVPGLLRQAAALAYSPIARSSPPTCPGPWPWGCAGPWGWSGPSSPGTPP